MSLEFQVDKFSFQLEGTGRNLTIFDGFIAIEKLEFEFENPSDFKRLQKRDARHKILIFPNQKFLKRCWY